MNGKVEPSYELNIDGQRVENYIVRIYRRESSDPDSVVGTVECVESKLHKPFHGLRRLGDLLTTMGMVGAEEAGNPSAASAINSGATSNKSRNHSEES